MSLRQLAQTPLSALPLPPRLESLAGVIPDLPALPFAWTNAYRRARTGQQLLDFAWLQKAAAPASDVPGRLGVGGQRLGAAIALQYPQQRDPGQLQRPRGFGPVPCQ